SFILLGQALSAGGMEHLSAPSLVAAAVGFLLLVFLLPKTHDLAAAINPQIPVDQDPNLFSGNELLIYAALQGMEHERWLLDEHKVELRHLELLPYADQEQKKEAMEHMEEKVDLIKRKSFGAAIDKLINQVGPETFSRVALFVLTQHARNLDPQGQMSDVR